MDPGRGHRMQYLSDKRQKEEPPWTMAMVSSSMGPVNCLLHKLPSELIFTDLRCQLEGIWGHLLRFCARGVVTDMLDRQWMKQLRELVYDIEDWIEKLLIHSGARFKPGKLSLNDSKRLQEFKDQIAHVQQLGYQCGILRIDFVDDVPSDITLDLEDNNTIPGNIDGMLHGEKTCVVGLDGQECEIVQHLIDKEQELKVVSILGPGGMGKTTLAKEVFRKQRSQFDCGALVYVGRYRSVRDTLIDIACQVMPKSLVPCDEKLITTKLWEYLFTKRYLIVIDNVWSISAWSSITCALPANDLGSRILATTEAENVAKFCCVKPIDFIYELKAVDYCDSRLLMLDRVFPEQDFLTDPNMLENIIKVCCGNPLAIVVTSGLLTAKGARLFESREFGNTVLSMMKHDSSVKMTEILHMSYTDLSLHLKSCFLYLSAFPENCTIMKDRLIRRWIAEDFIPARNGVSLWEVGESYVKELARRGLIQLGLNDSDDEICCTVHNVIHEFVRSLSADENFVTIGEHLSTESYPCHTIRRFTHDCSKQFESGILASMTVHLSKVRSFAVSGNTNKQLSDVSTFKLVRVLDLDGATGLGKRQLRSIRNLLLLRYLGLKGSDVYELPEQMKELQHLTTIDLRQTKVKRLPQLATAKLVSLLADHLVLPSGMDCMLELEELSMILVGHIYLVEKATKLIKESKLLRVLGVRFEPSDDQVGLMPFLDAVYKSSLQTFLVDDFSGRFLESLLVFRGHKSSSQLQKFVLNVSHNLVEKVPAEIGYLKDLSHLHIFVYELDADGLHILEGLPNLVLLHLDSHNILDRCIISDENCFRCLRNFRLRCFDGGMGLQFHQWVMPHLRKFQLVFSAEETKNKFGDFDFGINHLTCLEQVSVTINDSAPTSIVMAAKAAIKDQVDRIPNNTFLQLNISNQADLIE